VLTIHEHMHATNIYSKDKHIDLEFVYVSFNINFRRSIKCLPKFPYIIQTHVCI